MPVKYFLSAAFFFWGFSDAFGQHNPFGPRRGRPPGPALEREARARRCGNVEIARVWFWRDFQARGEPWKSPRPTFRLGRRRPDFPTVPTARHFHSD